MIPLPDVRERVSTLVDDDDDAAVLHAVMPTGSDGDVTYVLAFVEKHHEGRTYLNERYVMLCDGDEMSDTFMKNGINRRFSPHLAERLASMYRRIADRRENDITDNAMVDRIATSESAEYIGETDGE